MKEKQAKLQRMTSQLKRQIRGKEENREREKREAREVENRMVEESQRGEREE